jgi:Ssp1 endopeptidase immunity protein Rap1a
MATLNWPITC